MKKNVITKVLFMLVIFAMVLALVACGNSGNGGGSGTSTTTLKEIAKPVVSINKDGEATWAKVAGAGSYNYVIYDAEGQEADSGTIDGKEKAYKVSLEEGESIVVVAVPSNTAKNKESQPSVKATYTKEVTAVDKVVAILDGVTGLVDVINGIEADGKVGAEVILSAFFTNAGATNDVALDVKAGLDGKNQKNSTFMVDFQLNKKSYVSLGYSNGKILVRDPVNFINTDDKDPDAFYMDISALDASVSALVDLALAKLSGIEIEFDSVAEMLAGVLEPINSAAPLDTILSFGEIEGGGTSIGLNIGALATVLNLVTPLLKTLPTPIDIDEIGGKLDEGIAFVRSNLDENMFVLKDKTVLSWSYIKNKILEQSKTANKDNVLLKIDVATSEGSIKSVGIKFDLSALDKENMDLAFGLEVGVPTFALNQYVPVDTSAFAKKDLQIKTGVDLGIKGVKADLVANICLSDAFAKAGNLYGYANLTATTDGGDSGVAKGYINGTGAYVDLTGIFDLFGVTGKQTKYKQEYELEGLALDAFINDAVTGLVDSILNPAQNAVSIEGAIAAVQGGEKSIYAYIYNEIITLLDATVQPDENAGLYDILNWLKNYEFGSTGACADTYLKIDIAQESWTALGAQFLAAHTAGKAALEAAIFTDSENNIAGIQFSGDDSLLAYLDNFVEIPSINEGAIDLTETVSITDTQALKDWLNFIFDPKGAARKLVEDILGTSLEEVIDSVYFEAQGFDGLHGKVAAKVDAQGATYVSIEGQVALVAGTDSIGMQGIVNGINMEGAVNFNTESEGEYPYVIADAAMALLTAVCEY